MMSTELLCSAVPIIAQRITHKTQPADVARGSAAALQLIAQVLVDHPSFDLLLDLRDLRFADCAAHRAWRLGLLNHASIRQHVRRVAIIGRDTASFRAEQQLLETPRCRFFVDVAAGHAWLETIATAADTEVQSIVTDCGDFTCLHP